MTALVLLAACVDPTEEPATTPEPTSTTSTTPEPEAEDTAAAVLAFSGEAEVIPGVSWRGTESRVAIGVPNQTTLCAWTWTATDWATAHPGEPDPIPTPCADVDGNPCAFWFTVELTDGTPTLGDCEPYWGGPATDDGAWYGYGWTEHYLAYGADQGPFLLTWFPESGAWGPIDPYATWDAETGALSYLLVSGYGTYAP